MPRTADRGRRTPTILPEAFDAAQQALYDAIIAGPRGQQPGATPLLDRRGCLEGPFNAFLLQPALGEALQSLGSTLRYASGLDARSREIAILVVAVSKQAEFEAHAHEPIARLLGLTSEQLDGIHAAKYELLEPGEALIARATLEMLQHDNLSDETFSLLQAEIGDAQIFELTAVIGYYALLALQLILFQVPLPASLDK